MSFKCQSGLLTRLASRILLLPTQALNRPVKDEVGRYKQYRFNYTFPSKLVTHFSLLFQLDFSPQIHNLPLMSKTVYFLSDAHLGGEEENKEKVKEEKLLSLLEKIKGDAEYLYLVGDMFEFWFEYKNAIPKGHLKILSKLKELVDCGIKVTYLVGNHDFWLGDFFPKHLNIPIYKDHLEVVHQGKRVFISHGDGLAKKDWKYRILKKILRNRVNIFLYRQIPTGIGYPFAKFVSRRSRSWVQKRDQDFLQEYENFAKIKIDQGYDAVILAHTHVPIFQNLSKGVYLNLGDWFLHFTYGKLCDGLFSLEENL